MQLGFQNLKTQWVYIGAREGSDRPWYFWDHDKSQAIQIVEDSLVGYLKNIEVGEKEFKGKTAHKVIVTIFADRVYKLQSGLDTWFSKSLFARLNNLSPEELKKPIVISPYLGEDENIVFVALKNDQGIKIETEPNFDPSNCSEDYILDSIRNIQAKMTK